MPGTPPNRSNLQKRGIVLHSGLCPLCNREEETENHLFLNCSTAKELAASLCGWWGSGGIPAGTVDVAQLFISNQITHAAKRETARRAFLWTIWKGRNEAIFEGKVMHNTQLVMEVKKLSYSWFCNRGKDVGQCVWENWMNSIM